jgi:hypothetical protein
MLGSRAGVVNNRLYTIGKRLTIPSGNACANALPIVVREINNKEIVFFMIYKFR